MPLAGAARATVLLTLICPVEGQGTEGGAVRKSTFEAWLSLSLGVSICDKGQLLLCNHTLSFLLGALVIMNAS